MGLAILDTQALLVVHFFLPNPQNSKGTYSTHVFRLKRTKTKESLGLVLVTGDKVSG